MPYPVSHKFSAITAPSDSLYANSCFGFSRRCSRRRSIDAATSSEVNMQDIASQRKGGTAICIFGINFDRCIEKGVDIKGVSIAKMIHILVCDCDKSALLSLDTRTGCSECEMEVLDRARRITIVAMSASALQSNTS